VVFAGVATQKDELHRAQVATVGLDKSQDIFVELAHGFEVFDVKTHVAKNQIALTA